MSFQSDDRYATVRELANDLEHWLADEPVAAYPERRPERAARWLRQHRTWTYAAGAALIGISLAATIGVVVVEQGRRREAEARELAQTNFKLANTAVRDYLMSVSQNTLLKQQDSVDIRALRKELLETALKYYKDFVKQRGDDAQLRQELAEAHFRVGEIAREIGTTDELIVSFDAARAIWEQVAASAPDDPAPRGHVADCYLAVGERLTADKDFPAAIRPLENARAILEPIAAKHPDVPAYEASLAECYKEMGIAQAGQGFPERGLESLKKAEIIQKRLIDRSPENDQYRKKLADMINVQGYGYYQQGDYSNALRSFQEVQGICQSLFDQITSGPRPVQLLNSLALAHYNIATVERRNGNLQAELAAFETLAGLPIGARGRASVGDRFPGESRGEPRRDRRRPASCATRSGGVRLDPKVDRHPPEAGRFAAGSATLPRRAESKLERVGLPERRDPEQCGGDHGFHASDRRTGTDRGGFSGCGRVSDPIVH